ncbi:hypothetical protein DCS_02256 [Drechmeria coniospora]|uniref:Uncharacterized protein n=1 Tax=Drechmeria coniospora TaxID=98403 RepID=A0A151GVH9_DRECN|nr:hypothetical protein DCS_02256 [Drechmeria coniospora]KYK61115.1 hypothetical protein DCS_02256 [Drechmeria coniospora]
MQQTAGDENDVGEDDDAAEDEDEDEDDGAPAADLAPDAPDATLDRSRVSRIVDDRTSTIRHGGQNHR